MRKRSFSRSPTEIELFPFLSVLACTIGTLILLIIVLTTQMFEEQREVVILAKTERGKNAVKTPRYIECREDGIIIYPSETFVPQSQLNNDNSPLAQLLAEIEKNVQKQYLIVAIRPDGFEGFQKVREMVEKRGIDLGYEPLDEGWKLKIEQ